MSNECEHCKNALPPSVDRCPHCAWPGNYPNVRAAQKPEEIKALERRYQDARDKAKATGLEADALNFEKLASKSKTVISMSLLDFTPIALRDDEIFPTFHQKVGAGIKFPSGDRFSKLRSAYEASLFLGYQGQISFGALSLDGMGLKNYGGCYLTAKDDMIAHRTSIFEENNMLFIIRRHILAENIDELPKGFRAIWQDRGKLAVAKLADRLGTCKNLNELLLKNGKTTADDEFVEAHIYGSMTAKTFQAVKIVKRESKGMNAIIKRLREKFTKLGVTVELL